uniref:Uncharacterized protein n=1 Tax=Siphoviridae sp. ctmIh35 TaxID=2827932 RepID=A0A8S5T8L4_9CAUD|nr:MAG TPA: hypothetical protein [Siphoviridae sp. ctmIh35]
MGEAEIGGAKGMNLQLFGGRGASAGKKSTHPREKSKNG